MDRDISLREYKNIVSGTPGSITLEFTLATTHEARFSVVCRAIDFACNELEKNKHMKQELSEDQLTVEICQILNGMSFQAAHDEQVGGHCDIVIKGKDSFLWIAEAKIHNSYSWLESGFKQLSTRYSTGTVGQDQGEVLIYCKVRDAAAMLQKWKVEFLKYNSDASTHDDIGNPLVFWSIHKHAATGLFFRTRHKVLSLFFQPVNVP